MFDIFYIHNPLVNGPVGRQVSSIEEARRESRTRHCWIVDGLNDYSNFDWLWEPKPWEAQQDHVWPSQHQQNGGTTLITKDWNGDTNYSHQTLQRVSAHSIIFVDHGNKGSAARFKSLSERYSVSKTPLVGSFASFAAQLELSIKEPCWVISSLNDYSDFDFTWHPEPIMEGTRHIFGTQYHDNSGGAYFIYPRAHAASAPPFKLYDSKIKRVSPEEIFFVDHGNEGSQEQYEKLASEYEVTRTRFFSSMQGTLNRVASKLSRPAWVISSLNTYDDFDLCWYPDAWEEGYLHSWASQSQADGGTFYVPPKIKGKTFHKDPVPRTHDYPIVYLDYFCENVQGPTTRWFESTEKTLERIQKRIMEPTWVLPYGNVAHFDLEGWHPPIDQENMTHIWGTQHQPDGGLWLVYPWHEENRHNRVYHEESDIVTRVNTFPVIMIDYGNECELPFETINLTKTRYFGSTDATLDRIRAKIDRPTWVISSTNNYDEFDFTWHPPTSQEGDTQVWPSQHQGDGGTYLLWPHVEDRSCGTNYNWMVVPRTHAYDVIVLDAGGEYSRSDATTTRLFGSIGETLERIRKRISSPTWVCPSTNDFTEFDPTWHPPRSQENMEQCWPTQHQKEGGAFLLQPNVGERTTSQVYNHAPVYPRVVSYPKVAIVFDDSVQSTVHTKDQTSRFFGSYMDTVSRIKGRITEPTWVTLPGNDYSEFDFTWHPPIEQEGVEQVWGTQHQKDGGTFLLWPDAKATNYNKGNIKRVEPYEVIVVDHGNEHSIAGTSTRYMNSMSDTLERIQQRINKPTWVLSSYNDYSKFDLTWHPPLSQEGVIQQWPSQHQKNSDTYLLDGKTKTAYNTNDRSVKRTFVPDIVYLDFGNPDGVSPSGSYRSRFIDNYFDTLKRVVQKYLDKEYLWITASVCDYTDFDFTWHPASYRREMLHVFPSEDEEFGDTMLVPVKKFVEQMDKLELLEWFDKIHTETTCVPRRPFQFIFHNYDSQADAVKEIDFEGPYAIYSTTIENRHEPVPNLWRSKTRAIYPLTKGATTVLVPKDARNAIKEQLYDYPYIDKSFMNTNLDYPLDVVFLHNGETNAQDNLWALEAALPSHMKLHEVSGIDGRVAAYQACAEVAETDWLFIVWGKLEVNPLFDWSWQPDRMQAAKHYIFYAHNPVNGLEYGHMGMAAYNKRLTLENDGSGLDFIMSQPHEVVPIVSGTAHYDHNPWMTWRTAFREVIKLKKFVDEGNDVAANARLKTWMEVGNGEHGEWSIKGARDGLEYYNKVNGEYEKLKYSYEWAWLQDYFSKSYPG